MILKLTLYGIARIRSILVFLFILLTTTTAVAASVTLGWDPNDIAPEGYRVFARKSGQVYNYSQPAWEGAAVICTLDNLEEQTEYHFVVRAYDGDLESADSDEINYISSGPSSDTTPPLWDGATLGIGLVTDTALGGSVTVEFDTARDQVDGRNLRLNVYYAVSGPWNDLDWNVITDAAVVEGSTFAHAVTVSGLTNGVSYTFGVRVEDQSGNEEGNTVTLTATPTKNVITLKDNFSTDTTDNYTVVDVLTVGGTGQFRYNASGQCVRVLTGNEVGLQFGSSLPASTSGQFSIDFLPTVKYSNLGLLRIRLVQDENTYYELYNTDGYDGAKAFTKYVSGSAVDSVSFSNEYVQNTRYTLTIAFSPSRTTVNAFGQQLVINSNTSYINVSRFEVAVAQQDAYFDNISYSYGATDTAEIPQFTSP